MADPTSVRELFTRQKFAAVRALEHWMDGVLAEGQTHLAPIAEGTLRGAAGRSTADELTGAVMDAAGFVEFPDRVEVTGYFSTPYARRQHESLTVGEYMAAAGRTSTHPDDPVNHPRGGGPKFLEQPFKDRLPRIEPLMARAVRAVTP